MTLFKQGYALCIGVGADLPNTVDDAKGLAKILTDAGRCAYPENQVTTLTSEAATREKILEGLKELSKIPHDATALVYFSGHGYQVSTPIGEQYYLIPYGVNPASLHKTAVSGKELADGISAIPAKKVLLLLDCCHAGGLDPTKSVGIELAKSPLPPAATQLFAAGNGRVVIASSMADELSYAGKPYSVFTTALIEALAGQGVAEKDGYVRMTDLALYAREMVPQRTLKKQHPILNFEGADNFIVGYYAGGDKEPKALPFSIDIEPEPGAFNAAAGVSYDFYAHVTGNNNTVVHGNNNTVVGAGGVSVGGNMTGNIITGSGNTINVSPEPAQIPPFLIPLRNDIAKYFSSSEIKDLCFEMKVNPDDLHGETRKELGQSLVAYFYEREMLEDLKALCRKKRPKIAWD